MEKGLAVGRLDDGYEIGDIYPDIETSRSYEWLTNERHPESISSL
jgi:hypothetical protein